MKNGNNKKWTGNAINTDKMVKRIEWTGRDLLKVLSEY